MKTGIIKLTVLIAFSIVGVVAIRAIDGDYWSYLIGWTLGCFAITGINIADLYKD